MIVLQAVEANFRQRRSKRESRPNNKFKCLNYDHPFKRSDLESTTNEIATVGT